MKVACDSEYTKDVTDVEKRLKSFEEKASASLEDWQKYHELLKPAIEHGWITEKEGGGVDFNIKGPVLTKAFLQDVGGITAELEKFLQGNADLDLWSEANQVFKYLKKARDRVRMESVAPVQSNSDRSRFWAPELQNPAQPLGSVDLTRNPKLADYWLGSAEDWAAVGTRVAPNPPAQIPAGGITAPGFYLE